MAVKKKTKKGKPDFDKVLGQLLNAEYVDSKVSGSFVTPDQDIWGSAPTKYMSKKLKEQVKFRGGPLDGESITSTNSSANPWGKDFPLIYPMQTEPKPFGKVTLTAEGLHKPLDTEEEKVHKQFGYHKLYHDDNIRRDALGNLISRRRTAVYTWTLKGFFADQPIAQPKKKTIKFVAHPDQVFELGEEHLPTKQHLDAWAAEMTTMLLDTVKGGKADAN